MRVTPREFARGLVPADAKEMLEELLDAMPRDTVLEVLAERLDAQDLARLTGWRVQ
jgi:hypothetical protein